MMFFDKVLEEPGQNWTVKSMTFRIIIFSIVPVLTIIGRF